MRYLIVAFALLALIGCSTQAPQPNAAVTEVAELYVEGRDYRRLETPISGAPAVIELFYYGCQLCYYLTDDLSLWSRETGLTLSLIPAHGSDAMVDGARLFHTLAVLGRLDLHVAAYELFQQPSDLQGVDRVNALLDQQGISREQFWAAWSSDLVNQRLAGSLQLTELSATRSTPAFIVQGSYVVELSVIESSEGLLGLLSHLAALEQ